MTTVQDLGRVGFSHLGVSIAGAADAGSLRVANRLVGNAETVPCLEMTLKGGRFEFGCDAVVAVYGGDFSCSVALGRAVALAKGEVLEIGGCRLGARCYLAVRGGIVAKYDLGSASTHTLSGLGRVVVKDDVLFVGGGATARVSDRFVMPEVLQSLIRLTAGSGTGDFSATALLDLTNEEALTYMKEQHLKPARTLDHRHCRLEAVAPALFERGARSGERGFRCQRTRREGALLGHRRQRQGQRGGDEEGGFHVVSLR